MKIRDEIDTLIDAYKKAGRTLRAIPLDGGELSTLESEMAPLPSCPSYRGIPLYIVATGSGGEQRKHRLELVQTHGVLPCPQIQTKAEWLEARENVLHQACEQLLAMKGNLPAALVGKLKVWTDELFEIVHLAR